jgi:hypothetical protein
MKNSVITCAFLLLSLISVSQDSTSMRLFITRSIDAFLVVEEFEKKKLEILNFGIQNDDFDHLLDTNELHNIHFFELPSSTFLSGFDIVRYYGYGSVLIRENWIEEFTNIPVKFSICLNHKGIPRLAYSGVLLIDKSTKDYFIVSGYTWVKNIFSYFFSEGISSLSASEYVRIVYHNYRPIEIVFNEDEMITFWSEVENKSFIVEFDLKSGQAKLK